MKLVLIRKVEDTVTEHVVEAPDADAVYAECFREYFNREKYLNCTHTSFKDATHKEPYREWISDINNYARNGGDMW